jgi:hypothetical protein
MDVFSVDFVVYIPYKIVYTPVSLIKGAPKMKHKHKSFLVNLEDDDLENFTEIQRVTGQSVSEIMAFAISALHHRGEETWPHLIPSNTRERFRAILKGKGFTMTEWIKLNGFNPQMVYRVLTDMDYDPIKRRAAHVSQTGEIITRINEVLTANRVEEEESQI